MNIRKLAGVAILGLTALLAGSVSAQAWDRRGHDGDGRGYYSSRGSHSYGRSYRSYRYRAPRRYYSVRPYYYSARPYYDDYGYDAYYSAPPDYYYGRRYCRPRSRVGVFFGF